MCQHLLMTTVERATRRVTLTVTCSCEHISPDCGCCGTSQSIQESFKRFLDVVMQTDIRAEVTSAT